MCNGSVKKEHSLRERHCTLLIPRIYFEFLLYSSKIIRPSNLLIFRASISICSVLSPFPHSPSPHSHTAVIMYNSCPRSTSCSHLQTTQTIRDVSPPQQDLLRELLGRPPCSDLWLDPHTDHLMTSAPGDRRGGQRGLIKHRAATDVRSNNRPCAGRALGRPFACSSQRRAATAANAAVCDYRYRRRVAEKLTGWVFPSWGTVLTCDVTTARWNSRQAGVTVMFVHWRLQDVKMICESIYLRYIKIAWRVCRMFLSEFFTYRGVISHPILHNKNIVLLTNPQ